MEIGLSESSSYLFTVIFTINKRSKHWFITYLIPELAIEKMEYGMLQIIESNCSFSDKKEHNFDRLNNKRFSDGPCLILQLARVALKWP